MATEPIKLNKLYDGLKYKFLFNNDINSIYILLALYDLEENISNIYPRYVCTKNIRKRIKHILRDKENRDDISHNISYLIHEDINRLELCFYLEGYKYGYNNKRWVNVLENKAIELLGIEGLYKNRGLFHFISGSKEIKELKGKLRQELDNIERKSKYIEGLVYTFSNKVIKNKLMKVDKYISKQLRLNLISDEFDITEVNYNLSEEEIDKIYRAIVNLLIRNLKNIYKDACWFALNDKVMKRYL